MSDEKKTMFGYAAPQNLSIPTSSNPGVAEASSGHAPPSGANDGARTIMDGGPFQGHEPPAQGPYGGQAQPSATAPGNEHIPTEQGYAPPQGQHPGGPAPQGPYASSPQGHHGEPASQPQGQYGHAPQGQQGQHGGAPQGQHGGAPQGQYGHAPQGQYGHAPQGQYGGAPGGHAPQGQYGDAPGGHAPQGQYGGPPSQAQYGAQGGYAARGHLPQVKTVSTGLYLGMFFVSFLGFAMMGLGMADPKLTELVPFAGLPILVSIIFQWILLYKSWAAIQDGHARTTPGAAVGFLFIPLFSLYWIFIAYGSWGRNFNAFSRRHGVGFEVSEGLFTFHCFMMFFGGPIAIVTGIMMCLAMCRGINAIANRQYHGLPVARIAG